MQIQTVLHPSHNSPVIALVAGEHSGDYYGSIIIDILKTKSTHITEFLKSLIVDMLLFV